MKTNFWTSLLSAVKILFQGTSEQSKQKFSQSVAKPTHISTPDEPAAQVVESFEKSILYVDSEIGLNVRKTPKENNNKIGVLKFGEEVEVVEKNEDHWFKIKFHGNQEGWVASQHLTEENPKTSTSEIKREMSEGLIFKVELPNLPNDKNTIRVREIINHAFKYSDPSKISLQCVEYVQYAVKVKAGIDIIWPSDRPRHGGRWPDIFQKQGKYKISEEPTLYSAMSFANPSFNSPYGHVAFVGEVFSDGTIKISEANWPSKGIYNERVLSKQQWSQKKWGAKFIEFTKDVS